MAKATNKTTIQFYKTRFVESPSYNSSVGIDFYIPYNLTVNEISTMQSPRYDANEPRVQIKANQITGEIEQYTIPPRARLVMPTGVKMKFPEGKSGLFLNKGRVALNAGVCVLNSFVDGKTTDELKINIVNTSDVPVNVTPGKQIAQMIIIDTPLYELEQVEVASDFYEGVQNEEVIVIDPVEKVSEPAPVVIEEKAEPVKPTKAEKTKKKQAKEEKTRLSEEDLRRIEAEVENAYADVNAHLNTIGG